MTIKSSEATLWLVLGYFVGQGAAFVLQLALRSHAEPAAFGTAALFLSVMSFCFIFTDLGNATYANRLLIAGSAERHASFSYAKLVVGVPVVFITAAYTTLSIPAFNELMFAGIVTVGATQFALTHVGKFEVAGQYRLFAIAQSMPWLITAVLLWFVFGLSIISPMVGVTIWSSLSIINRVAVNSLSAKYFKSRRGRVLDFSQFATSVGLLLPTIIGQSWVRIVLTLVADKYSLAAVGSLAIMRSIHTFGSMMLAFLLRPRLRIHAEVGNGRSLVYTQKAYFVLSFAVLGLCIAFVPAAYALLPLDLAIWYPLVIGVPLWGVANVFTADNQFVLGPAKASLIEIGSMCALIISFLGLQQVTTMAWAFVGADLVRLLVLVAAWKFLTEKRSNAL